MYRTSSGKSRLNAEMEIVAVVPNHSFLLSSYEQRLVGNAVR